MTPPTRTRVAGRKAQAVREVDPIAERGAALGVAHDAYMAATEAAGDDYRAATKAAWDSYMTRMNGLTEEYQAAVERIRAE